MSKTKTEQKERSFAMLIDFMRNPIFLPNGIPPDGFDGKLHVDGQLKVTLEGPPIDGDAADVFYALANRARERKFSDNKVSFVINDLNKQLNLRREGHSYLRIRKAIEALYNVSVEIHGVMVGNKRIDGGWRILTGRILYDGGNSRQDKGRFDSWIRFSEEMVELFREGAFKFVHPIYFKLPGHLDKRLFVLISVRASDLSKWEIPAFTLRDLIPLLGERYRVPSNVLFQLKRNLTNLQKFGVIHGFEFLKASNPKDPVVAIRPNHEFYISKSNSIRRSFLEKKQDISSVTIQKKPNNDLPAVQLLVEKGISKKAAAGLATQYPIETINAKIKLVEQLIKEGKSIKSESAFLVEAIKNDYQAPLSAIERDKLEKDAKKKEEQNLIKKLELLLEEHSYQEAITETEKVLSRGFLHMRLRDRLEDIRDAAWRNMQRDSVAGKV